MEKKFRGTFSNDARRRLSYLWKRVGFFLFVCSFFFFFYLEIVIVLGHQVLGHRLVLTVDDVHQKFAFVFFEQLPEFVWLGQTAFDGRQEYTANKTTNTPRYNNNNNM